MRATLVPTRLLSPLALSDARSGYFPNITGSKGLVGAINGIAAGQALGA
jgi:hypothetical protein